MMYELRAQGYRLSLPSCSIFLPLFILLLFNMQQLKYKPQKINSKLLLSPLALIHEEQQQHELLRMVVLLQRVQQLRLPY